MCRNESYAVSVQLVVKYKTQNIWLFLGQSISTSSNAMMGFHCIHSQQFPFLYALRFHFYFISLSFALFLPLLLVFLLLHRFRFVHSFHQDWHKHTYCVCVFAVTMLLPLTNAAFNPLQQHQLLRYIHLLPHCNQALFLFIPLIWKNTWYFSCWNLFYLPLSLLAFRSHTLLNCVYTFICPM